MKNLTISAASLNQIPFDFEHNSKNIKDAILSANSCGAEILVLPELCLTGYGCEDIFFITEMHDKAEKYLNEINKLAKDLNILVFLGSIKVFNGSIYNCCCVLGLNNNIIYIPKQNLCSDGIHYEPRWFKPWNSSQRDINNDKIGKFIINYIKETYSVKIGVEICEDAWVHNRPAIELANSGVDVIVNLSASHFSFGKENTRRHLIEQSSRAYNCVYVYANLLGNEAGRVIYDGDTYIASCGRIVAEGKRLSFDDYTLIVKDVDIDRNSVRKLQSHEVNNESNYEIISHYNYANNIDYITEKYYKKIEMNIYESFTRAVTLGLWDYMRKSKTNGFALSLSGGADSAAVACIIRSMVKTLIREKNADFIESTFNVDSKTPELDKVICSKLLTCVYQSTENSSDTTAKAAEALAKQIGAKFADVSVQEIYQLYTNIVEKIAKRSISWDTDNIALQNIQARTRAPLIWMVANINNFLLLNTSNRSEAAVGYTTADGDSCGSISPIAGVSKKFILEWLNYYHTENSMTEEFDALKHILNQQPTAELKPLSENQSDEKDLMSYDLLNTIETCFVRDKMGPNSIKEHLDFRHDNEVDKFFNLFCKNQWKREKYATSFHLDDESLDPKTFFRFPILNRGI